MRILLHGATNFGSSNFGDFIYASELYFKLKADGVNVCFYSLSDYFSRYLVDYQKPFKFNKADCLLYIPGGYFIEDSNSTFKSALFRYYRYFFIGDLYRIMKKKIGVLAVGAGPVNNSFLKRRIKSIFNDSNLLTVRDDKSLDFFSSISINNCFNYSDVILSFNLKDRITKSKFVQKLVKEENKPLVVIHYNHDKNIMLRFVDLINSIPNKDEFLFVVSSDCIVENEDELFSVFNQKIGGIAILFKYSNPYEFLDLLYACKMIVTCKLHAGVVSAMFGKSVLCLAINPEKTKRFYSQIGRLDCFFEKDVLTTQLAFAFNSLLQKPIIIPRSLIDLSCEHFIMLDKWICELQNEK